MGDSADCLDWLIRRFLSKSDQHSQSEEEVDQHTKSLCDTPVLYDTPTSKGGGPRSCSTPKSDQDSKAELFVNGLHKVR